MIFYIYNFSKIFALCCWEHKSELGFKTVHIGIELGGNKKKQNEATTITLQLKNLNKKRNKQLKLSIQVFFSKNKQDFFRKIFLSLLIILKKRSTKNTLEISIQFYPNHTFSGIFSSNFLILFGNPFSSTFLWKPLWMKIFQCKN